MSNREFVLKLYNRAAQVLLGELEPSDLVTPEMLRQLMDLARIDSFEVPGLPIAWIDDLSSASARNTARAAFIGEVFGVDAFIKAGHGTMDILDETELKARRAILAAIILAAQHLEMAKTDEEGIESIPDRYVKLVAVQFSEIIRGNVLRFVAEEGALSTDQTAAASGYRGNKAHVMVGPLDWDSALERLQQISADAADVYHED